MAEIDPHWAWEPYKPSSESPWDLRKVGHLYRRAGFSAKWTELEAGVKAGPDETIDLLLKGGPGEESFESLRRSFAESAPQQLRAGWLYWMLNSRYPLREKLTLFWHNHFATSNSKVQNFGLMIGQYQLMQRHALGSFRDLLDQMSRDPAMMVWLDTRESKKG